MSRADNLAGATAEVTRLRLGPTIAQTILSHGSRSVDIVSWIERHQRDEALALECDSDPLADERSAPASDPGARNLQG